MLDGLDLLESDEFRERIRRWLALHCPNSIRRPVDRLQGAEARMWHRVRYEHGLIAPSWPKEYGGLGLSVDQQIVLFEEFEKHGIARIFDSGPALLGPTLIEWGNAAQREYYLPRILSGDDMWCQGYSEPGAGSDLAALRTRAERDGDHYIVNGQKIWTSAANHATHCFMLVRTSSEGPKQKGISFLLVDLNSPGVRVRPILNLAGQEELCEVFLDDVRVPAENLVGKEGQGWTIAKSLLGFERLAIGHPAPPRLAIGMLRAAARELGVDADPVYRSDLAKLLLGLHELTCLFRASVDAMRAGEVIENDLSVLKITASELFQAAAERLLALASDHGAAGQLDAGNEILDLRQLYMTSRPNTIFGGSSEIQRNILAKRWLGLA
jgi:alkylation response protein AidB-like acyl-CoA dehydrogenase